MKKKPEGRPTLYRAEYARMAFRHCLLGATDADLAALFSTVESTINLWKLKHPEFSESIKAGKEDADSLVAEACFSRAVGHSKKAQKIFCHEGQIIRADFVEYWPPDPAAQRHWLSNRQGKKWRNADTELTANINIGEQVAIELAKTIANK